MGTAIISILSGRKLRNLSKLLQQEKEGMWLE